MPEDDQVAVLGPKKARLVARKDRGAESPKVVATAA